MHGTRPQLSFETLEDRQLLSATPPTVESVMISSTDWAPAFTTLLSDNGMGTHGYAMPTGSTAQMQPLPWSGLDRVTLRFSEDVNVDVNDLSITGAAGGQYGISGFMYDPQTRLAEWTMSSPIAAGERVHLDLDADGAGGVADLLGNALDGEWTDSVSSGPSGDGVAGGDFEFRFNVLEGDGDQNAIVQMMDYWAAFDLQGFGTGDGPEYNPLYDIDGNGHSQFDDVLAVLANMHATLPSGSPLGVTNDAPTAVNIGLISAPDDQQTYSVSLGAVFDDSEDADSALTYSIVSVSEPLLLDLATVHTVSGEFHFSPARYASARVEAVVQATDTGGLSVEETISIDVGAYSNQPPIITDYVAESLSYSVWLISGRVSDADEDVVGMIVELTGVINTRAVVREDGTFSVATVIPPAVSGSLFATVADGQGAASNSPFAWIGLT